MRKVPPVGEVPAAVAVGVVVENIEAGVVDVVVLAAMYNMRRGLACRMRGQAHRVVETRTVML